MEIYNHEKAVFDLYFASIVTMAHCHPGTTRDPAMNLSIEDCAAKALEMLNVRRKIVQEYP